MERASRALLVPFAVLLFLQTPSVIAANHGPFIETADPQPGSYSMAGPGTLEVEIECSDDPDGDDVYVDFLVGNVVVETDEDLWGFSPSYVFELDSPGTYTFKARCRDTAGASGTPNLATWSIEVAGQASGGTEGNSGVTAFEWVDPEVGEYALDGSGSFDVEVECESNDGVTVEFLVDGDVVETDEDILGFSPSYSFLLVTPGPHTLGARCTSAAGSSQPVEWAVTVPSPSTTDDILRQAKVCIEVQDPSDLPGASGEAGRVQTLLVANAGVWHRSGPWTCELAKLAGPVGVAYDIDVTLVGVKAQLEEWAVFDYSTWDFVAGLYPSVVPAWEFFESLVPVLEACSTALDGVDAFNTMRTASLGFLSNPTDEQLLLLKGVAEQVLPAYSAWIGAIDLAAAKVDELTAFLADLAQQFLAAAAELMAGEWFPFRDSIGDGLTLLGDIAAEWASTVHAVADGIRALADPIRNDLAVLDSVLHPPASEGTPAFSPAWLFLALALLAFAVRRRS